MARKQSQRETAAATKRKAPASQGASAIPAPGGEISGASIAIVAVVTLGAFVALLNQTIMSPALPGLMRDFGINAGDAQWVTSIYMLVSGIMVPVSGYLIDKFSTRKLFFASMGAFIVGTLLCAAAPAYLILLLGRVLQAAGSGVLLPLVATVPLLVFPPEKRGTAMGVAGIVMAAGPAVGPVVGGMIIDSMGWRPMFLMIAPLAALILVLGLCMLRNVGTLSDPGFDILSVVLSTVAFGCMLYGFSSASNMGWSSPVVIVCIVLGIAALVMFVVRQRRLAEPLLRLEALATKDFLVAAIVVTLINAAVSVTNVTLPIFLQNVLGVSAATTGMVMLPAAAVGIVLSPVAGVLFDRRGPRGLAVVGLIVMTLGLFMLSRVNAQTTVIYVAVFCMVQAIGQGLANMPVNTWGVNSLPNDLIAHGNAIANTGRQVFGAISTAIIVTVMTSVTASNAALGDAAAQGAGISASYLVCAAISFVTLLVCIFFVRPTHHRAAAPAKK